MLPLTNARRGSRIAKRQNAQQRREEALYASGVLSSPKGQQERQIQALGEALPCPYCDDLIHPANWGRHLWEKHSSKAGQHDSGLKLEQIRTNGGTQCRDGMNEEVIEDYMLDMACGDPFPPATVFYDGTNYWLADGFHRMEARRRMGFRHIEADIRQGTQREAVLFSATEANLQHGLPLNNHDKRRRVEVLLNDPEWRGWSDREIARRCGCSPYLVRTRRAAICDFQADSDTITVQRGGSTYQMRKKRTGKGRQQAAALPTGDGAPQLPPAPGTQPEAGEEGDELGALPWTTARDAAGYLWVYDAHGKALFRMQWLRGAENTLAEKIIRAVSASGGM